MFHRPPVLPVPGTNPRPRWRRRPLRWLLTRLAALTLILVALPAFVDPPTTLTIRAAGNPPRVWTPMHRIAPAIPRAVVAAEDANFCRHWGFDMAAIRAVIASGSRRGASTLTQQTVKNVYLWQGRSWARKAAEAVLTPLVEAVWTKRRILEVYLNVAQFGPGVFGIHAAAAHHFGTTPDRLTPVQAARLAAVLPAPGVRAPVPSRRARAIEDGAAFIALNARDACFR